MINKEPRQSEKVSCTLPWCRVSSIAHVTHYQGSINPESRCLPIDVISTRFNAIYPYQASTPPLVYPYLATHISTGPQHAQSNDILHPPQSTLPSRQAYSAASPKCTRTRKDFNFNPNGSPRQLRRRQPLQCIKLFRYTTLRARMPCLSTGRFKSP